MTGGHNVFAGVTIPGDVGTTIITPVRIKKGNKFDIVQQVVEYTTGGQIGAPQEQGCSDVPPNAKCVGADAATGTPGTCFGGTKNGQPCANQGDCPSSNGRSSTSPWGDWQHTHHQGYVAWNTDECNGVAAGSFGKADGSSAFDFHSGTAAAPPEAFIHDILCADPGWCVQARCAPDKQIFWEGTGVFHNVKNIDPQSLFGTSVTVGTKGRQPSIHYYRAHVGDFGEPAGNKQNDPGSCPWTDATGVSIRHTVVTDDVTSFVCPAILGCTDGGQFSEGFEPIQGISCSDDSACASIGGGAGPGATCVSGQCVPREPFASEGGDICASCPDWYEIEIHATPSPDSPIIYKVGNFIREGNFQIHPPVGSNCQDIFGIAQ